MSVSSVAPIPHVYENSGTLGERLDQIHKLLLDRVPVVDRIACALYDESEDLLKTFINSTRSGESIAAHEYPLSGTRELCELAKTGAVRVVDDVEAAFAPDTEHSRWLLNQGYRSSFTVPLYDLGRFSGFLFFDSFTREAFTPTAQRDLLVHCQLINMAISEELASVRTILASARVARDFADLRDFETGAHLERMAHYAREIARGVAMRHGIGDEMIEHIFMFAPLHDIGKIGIPDRILRKPGKLDPDERREMETHVEKGVELIRRVIGDFGLDHLADSRVMTNMVAHHHELLDGSGYPKGLVGGEIPVEARIVTVADIFDALTSRRPYKQPWPVAEAVEELERMVKAGKLDGDCVAVVRREIDRFADWVSRYSD